MGVRDILEFVPGEMFSHVKSRFLDTAIHLHSITCSKGPISFLGVFTCSSRSTQWVEMI